MSAKIIAIVALALIGTLAAYHFTHRGGNKNAVVENFNSTNATNTSHYVPNKVLLFQNYKLKNGLKFGAAEDSKRFEVFSNNVDYIRTHNEKLTSYKLGLTSLAHLTREEFAALKLGLIVQNVTEKSEALPVLESNGKDKDWVKEGAVTPVKNQGNCGSCWAFSTTGALEGLQYIKDKNENKKLLSFSEQELVDCSTSYGNNGCNGGLMDYGFKYVAENGIATEEDYPYQGVDGTCQRDSKKKKRAFKNLGFKNVPENNNDALIEALGEQPVSVAIEADTTEFQLYKEGVLTSSACGTQLDHGVLAVGYGTLDTKPYIKVKNSWGASWGKDGFVLIGQAKGAGVCGINKMASYPTAK